MLSDASTGSFRWNKSIVGVLAISSGITQLIGLTATLVLGHLYSPSEYGQYSVAINVASVIAPLLTFSMEIFIVPAKSDMEARSYTLRILKVMLRNFVVLFICAVVLQNVQFGVQSHSIKISTGLLAGLVLAFLYAIFSVVTQILLREQEFRKLAVRNPIQISLIAAFQFTLSAPGTRSFGLILGEYFGRVAGIAFLAKRALRILKGWRLSSTTEEIKLNKYSQIMVNFVSIVFDLLSVSAIIFFTSIFFSHSDVGHVAMAQRILSFPTVLFGTVFSQYLLSKGASELRNGRRLNSRDFNSILRPLISIGILILGIIYFTLPFGIRAFLGESWLQSINAINSLILATLISFIWSPLSALFYVYRKWNGFLLVSAVRFVFILIAAAFSRFEGMTLGSSLVTISLSASVAQLGGIWYLRQLCAKHPNS
jgi:O-antigen/teichoic acid export membrane protein